MTFEELREKTLYLTDNELNDLLEGKEVHTYGTIKRIKGKLTISFKGD